MFPTSVSLLKSKVQKKLCGSDWNCKKGKFVKLSALPLTYLVEGHQKCFGNIKSKIGVGGWVLVGVHRKYCLGKHLGPLLADVWRPTQKRWRHSTTPPPIRNRLLVLTTAVHLCATRTETRQPELLKLFQKTHVQRIYMNEQHSNIWISGKY